MTQPLLRVQNLHKGFPSPSGTIDVLKGVSLSLSEGEFLAVIGESGSGKSTLLQLLGTLEKPDQGEAWLDGDALFELSSRQQAKFRNEKLGFVYQAHHLIPELTARENVMLPLLVGGCASNDASKRAESLLERLALSERMSHVPAKLSGGEAQRVAIARSMVVNPRLLLADEPTGNLDEHNAHEVFLALKQLCVDEKAAVVMVTHSQTLAHSCDRFLHLEGGQLLT